ncbi:putative ABC transport system permease protein [Methanosarcina thermophila]|jgi:putative ABC transport system permease protein|uniref:ABC transporter, permease protein n=3 Tax=Methanosarcina thermophila TaxID=2210 RepID=A0A1I6X6R1_METTE|nr:ABC transporter permease [Methanosarcina thermophila]ALK04634.1 MAG: ABC transporter permease [Methanosarcina sp. 795]AKB13311.1 ABC transporter, permease protein [Methanosarcina thermophila TM-1]AKB16054.1 ABC transporter, permease protein [Methanosarcina thermophila CHTI-55]NLU57423.1 ABC transporter permease [Methanosarcina thermophila]SFT33949.1 putative ABC transport system permease protein [Methanosarcina thermophila]
MIKFAQAVRIASGSIGSAKLRSALTTLGIVIGVAAVVVNASLGASFNQFFTDEISSVGSNFIIAASKQPNLFFDNEYNLIKNTPGITGVSPRKTMSGDLTYLSETKSVNIAGINEDFQEIQGLQMEKGTFLSDKDSFAAVLGYNIANEEFSKKISHRSNVKISFRQEDGTLVTKSFKVKGVLKDSEPTVVSQDSDYDLTVFIPISTMNEMIGEKDYGVFLAMADSPEKVRSISDEVDRRLARNFGVPEREIDDEDSKPYYVFNQEEVLEQTGKIGDALNSFLLALALISLLVGSIGIMNIMLVTVTERTREIGIMKSVGYSNSNILSLFLLESVMVSLFGGIVGTLIGGLGAYALESALDLPPVFPLKLIEIGIAISILVGITAGLYPARKAARMNPVDALRYE